MSDGGGELDKSEQATPHKLHKAREKGSVARGMDLGFLTGLAAFCGYAWLVGPSALGQIAQGARDAFVTAPHLVGGGQALGMVIGHVFASAVRPIAFMAGVLFLVVLAFEIVQTGPVFSTHALKPDFSRLNPATGLKRLFSVRLLIETLKNILKFGVYVSLTYVVVRQAQTTMIPALNDGRALAAAMVAMSLRLLVYFVVAAVAFAALDQILSRRQFTKQMRMSRRDVRRESRDREGEPRMKQKRKQLHKDFVSASQSLRNVRGADVLVVNPTHFAVALKYAPGVVDAPRVVAKGADNLAGRLKRLAFVYGVVIIEDRLLARALHLGVELNGYVPESMFTPVARVYRAAERARASAAAGLRAASAAPDRLQRTATTDA